MILLLDNYDSFVYNLDRYLRQLGHKTVVIRSDAISVDSIERLGCEAIVISPGPKTPQEAGCSLEVIRRLSAHLPILGVCLGHQAIGQAYGAVLARAKRPIHGKATMIRRVGQSRLLGDLPMTFRAGRYHSLIIQPSPMPESLRVTATSDEGEVMAIEHQSFPLFGVQFHPESILSEYGMTILATFLRIANLPTPEILPQGDWAGPMPQR